MIGQSGLRLLVAYESSTQYQPRFDFYGIGERSVRTILKEVDGAAMAVAETPDQVVRILDYAINGRLAS